MKRSEWVLVVLLFALLLAASRAIKAAPPYPMTLTVCAGYTVSKRGDGAVLVRCPGKPFDQPLFTFQPGACPNPSVTHGTTTVTINC